MINIYLNDIILKNFNPGVQGGYLYLKGNSSDGTEHYDAAQSTIFPLGLHLEYKLSVLKELIAQPVLFIGAAFNQLEYVENDELIKTTFTEPYFSGGIAILYKFNSSISFGIGGEYGLIYESIGILPFVTINACLDLKFDI